MQPQIEDHLCNASPLPYPTSPAPSFIYLFLFCALFLKQTICTTVVRLKWFFGISTKDMSVSPTVLTPAPCDLFACTTCQLGCVGYLNATSLPRKLKLYIDTIYTKITRQWSNSFHSPLKI